MLGIAISPSFTLKNKILRYPEIWGVIQSLIFLSSNKHINQKHNCRVRR